MAVFTVEEAISCLHFRYKGKLDQQIVISWLDESSMPEGESLDQIIEQLDAGLDIKIGELESEIPTMLAEAADE